MRDVLAVAIIDTTDQLLEEVACLILSEVPC